MEGAAEGGIASEPRVIFLNEEVLEILMEAGNVRGLGHNRVFTYNGQPIASIKTCFRLAYQKAGLINFRFHDLRHTFNTNMRKAGADPSVIMKLTGHKTTAMFHRYNTVDTQDAQEAYRKLEEFLHQQAHLVITGTSAAGAEEVLP
jgi:integrase